MKYLKLLTLFTVALLAGSCGDDNDDGGSSSGGGGTTPTGTAPKVITTSPNNGATDIALGEQAITITFDQPINVAGDISKKVTATGATLGNISFSNASLSFKATCNTTNTAVVINVAAGAVKGKTGGVENAAYTFSYTTVKGAEPVNPDISSTPATASTEEAKKLYSYLLEQYGKKTISSVMANVNWNNECAEKVYQLTGKYPAMNCYDFIHILYSPANWIDYTTIKPVQDWVNAGGLVQLMWHFNVPKFEGSTDATCTPSETTFKASNALVSGTWENKWFYEQMDKVVATLLKLQDAGIAATWRPFHEAAGNATAKQQAYWTKAWFWWGYDGAETYKKLWIAMFDYFKEKGVKNLIWVWTTQNYNGNSTNYNQDTNWYPGDEYVDIVARDLYGYKASQHQQEFEEIQRCYPNKMVALGECGWDGNSSKESATPDEYWEAGAKWSHFMVWYQGNNGTSTGTMCSDAWWKKAMSDASVITRDQVK